MFKQNLSFKNLGSFVGLLHNTFKFLCTHKVLSSGIISHFKIHILLHICIRRSISFKSCKEKKKQNCFGFALHVLGIRAEPKHEPEGAKHLVWSEVTIVALWWSSAFSSSWANKQLERRVFLSEVSALQEQKWGPKQDIERSVVGFRYLAETCGFKTLIGTGNNKTECKCQWKEKYSGSRTKHRMKKLQFFGLQNQSRCFWRKSELLPVCWFTVLRQLIS